MREIKFRVWDESRKKMVYIFSDKLNSKNYCIFPKDDSTLFCGNYLDNGDWQELELLQFTGRKCYNKKDVYEGDILFYEEQEDSGDVRYYLVVVWIQEWNMFASLHIDEYLKYIKSGAEALDEVMFWTYTLEGSEGYHYAGNIFENPELLQS